MKKTLLGLLFLFTNLFYAQVSDIEHCAGDNSFNLTSQKTLLIGNLNPAETTVTYHLSLADATNNTNTIASPTNYVSNAASKTIYARIDNNGVVTTNYFNLIVNNLLMASVTSTAATCDGLNNGSISVSVSGGKSPISYRLDFGEEQSSNIFNNLSSGSYQIYVRDAIGCLTLMYVTVEGPPVLTTVASIEGQSIIVNTQGGTGEYQYSLDGIHFQTSNIFTNLNPGNYTIIIRDSNNCGSTPINVLIPDLKPLSATAVISKPIDCFSNASINVSGSGGKGPYQYSLNGGTYQTSSVFKNILPGTYLMTVKDVDNTKTNTNTITIDPLLPLTATITHTNITNCSNIANCTIDIKAVGGQAPYQYSINKMDYQTQNFYSGAFPGTHIVDVKDAKGCIYTTSLIIESPSALVATATVTKQCGVNDIATITATGGQPPYTYSFTGGNTFFETNVSNNLTPKTHTLFVKDSNGCIYTVYTTVGKSTAINASVNITKPTNDENNDGKITIYGYGGTGKLIYAISPNLNHFFAENIFSNLTYGIYTVLILDENGCSLVKEISINPPAPLIDGKNTFTIDFTPGQTLGDIIVDGQNIKWYSSQNSTGKTNKTAATTLPLTTVLVDGVTYYASQTINNIESTQRLAVTAKSNGALSNQDFVLPNFKFYPNPVKNKLALSNTANIDEVELLAVSGKSVLVKKINDIHSEIDLSNISTGVYFLKVKSEGKTKTIKIVKE